MRTRAGHFFNGQWVVGQGPPLSSTDPATGETTWEGTAATTEEVTRAVLSARAAAGGWADTPYADRVGLLNAIAAEYRKRKGELAGAICRDTGKPRWEATAEVDVMIAKVGVSIDAYEKRAFDSQSQADGVTTATRFRPHGVVAVLGPFNMPGHLPNGHIVPALLAGNTVVFKPSEQAPLVGHRLAEIFEAVDLAPGVFNVVQGGRQTGSDLAGQPQLDGLFFTGSAAVGLTLSRNLAEHPGKILALEMGGNNPLVFHGCGDLDAAVYVTIQSAFITAGQRCSCARRLIVVDGPQSDGFIERLVAGIGRLRVGFHTDPEEPFMGPVISARAADGLLVAQARLIKLGGRPLVPMTRSERSPALLTPGLVDVTRSTDRGDAELFGPILQLIRVPTFAEAIREANNTRYGLSAGLLSDDRKVYEAFYRSIRAGIVNWNRPLTGANSKLPFGGVGESGNHRPSAYFAADYCSYPVGSMETEHATLPHQPFPGLGS